MSRLFNRFLFFIIGIFFKDKFKYQLIFRLNDLMDLTYDEMKEDLKYYEKDCWLKCDIRQKYINLYVR